MTVLYRREKLNWMRMVGGGSRRGYGNRRADVGGGRYVGLTLPRRC